MKSSVHLLKLRSAFLCLLMERREAGGAARVHTMKPGVVDRMFNLKIGNERKSIQVLARILPPYTTAFCSELWLETVSLRTVCSTLDLSSWRTSLLRDRAARSLASSLFP